MGYWRLLLWKSYRYFTQIPTECKLYTQLEKQLRIHVHTALLYCIKQKLIKKRLTTCLSHPFFSETKFGRKVRTVKTQTGAGSSMHCCALNSRGVPHTPKRGVQNFVHQLYPHVGGYNRLALCCVSLEFFSGMILVSSSIIFKSTAAIPSSLTKGRDICIIHLSHYLEWFVE